MSWRVAPINVDSNSHKKTAGLPAAMLLDMDDTILATSQDAERCLRLACETFAPRVDGLEADALFAGIQQQMDWFWSDPKRHRQGRLSRDFSLRDNIAAALSRLGVEAPSLPEEMPWFYLSCRERSIRPVPGALETVKRLRSEGVRLALVTNGSTETQNRKIEVFGLVPLFDYILIEGEFGHGKPDERVYLHALDQLNATPEQSWMVGDNLQWEVAAPQRLGIFAVWVDVAGEGLPEGSAVRPDRIIRTLSEILQPPLSCPCTGQLPTFLSAEG